MKNAFLTYHHQPKEINKHDNNKNTLNNITSQGAWESIWQ